MEKKIIYVFLVIIIATGLYLRTSGTYKGFFAFTFDQGRDFIKIKELVDDKNLTLIGPPTGIDGVFHGVWWFYFLSPWYWIWKGNPTGVVLTFNILATSAIGIAYFLGKIISDRKLGVIFSAIVCASPFFIGTAAQLWHPHVEPILILILLIMLWRRLTLQVHFAWLAFILGAIVEFEFGSGGLFVCAFVIALIFFKIWPKRKELMLSLLAFGLWLTPRFIFELKNNFIQGRSLIKFIDGFNKSPVQTDLFFRLIDRLKTFLDQQTNAFAKDNLLGFWLLLIGIVGVVFSLKHDNHKELKKFIYFSLVLIGILVILASVYPNVLWSYYLISVPPLILVSVGNVFYRIIRKFNRFGWILFLGYIIYLLNPTQLLNKTEWAGDAATYKNQLIVINAIYQDVNGEQFNYQVYSPSVIDYTYRYLFNWYGQQKFGYIPEAKLIKPVTYYILEPDQWQKGLRNIWLKERQGDGETLWRKTFAGGIEVEKRIRLLNYFQN